MRTDGKDTLFAAVTDRQNSLTAVRDAASGLMERYAYKPWGMRRDADDWTKNVRCDDEVKTRFDRGYCMHQHLPHYGLIDMFGRMYDPYLCQFVSADPYVQAPESWLCHNRFAFCMQNPVMYTDPDGRIACFIPILFGVVAGVINVAVKCHNGQVNNFWQGLGAFGVGFTAGAVSTLVFAGASAAIGSMGFMNAFACGFVSEFAMNTVQSIGNSAMFGDRVMSAPDMLKSCTVSGLTAGAIGGVMAARSGLNFWTGKASTLTATPKTPETAVREAVEEKVVGKDAIGAEKFEGNGIFVTDKFLIDQTFLSEIIQQIDEEMINIGVRI